MKKLKKLLVGGLTLALIVSLVAAACAPAAPEEVAEEIAELEAEIADLEDDVAAEKTKTAAEKAKVSDLEKEIAALKKPAEVYEWRMQTWVVAAQDLYIEMCAPFADKVREASDGRIDITVYPAGELVANTDILDSCAKGVFEIAMSCPAYFKGLIPILDMESGLPGTFRKHIEAEIFFHELGFIDLLREAYAEQGIRYISPLTSGGFAFLSKVPITSIDDFEGVKIRTIGYTAELVEALGAATVYVPVDEIYMALATGVVDAASFGDIYSMYPLKFHEVTDYYSQPNVLYLDWNSSFMNLNLWEELPEDLQAVLYYAARELGDHSGRISEHGATEYLDIVKKDYGIEVTWLPESDMNEMAVVSKSCWEKLEEKDDYCARGVKMLKDYLRSLGYID